MAGVVSMNVATPVPSTPDAGATLNAAFQMAVATEVAATPATAPSSACRLWLTATVDVAYRAGPGLAFGELGTMLAGQSAEVTGRDAFYSWWRVPLLDGGAAWVPKSAVQLSDCANYPAEVALPTG
jgi:uncharacterized protein YraI